MKKSKIIFMIATLTTFITILSTACKTSETILAKSGAQVWGESCIHCHNPASPATFSDVEWDVAAMHMRIRASLTPEETQKVVEFLQTAN